MSRHVLLNVLNKIQYFHVEHKNNYILAGDEWWPFFVTICFLVTDIIVLSDPIFQLNKQGVHVGIILFYFFK